MSFRRGETKGAKLKPSEVEEIRQRYSMGQTQGELSREFQVSITQIGRIVRREVWQSVRTEPTEAEVQGSVDRLAELLRQGIPVKERVAEYETKREAGEEVMREDFLRAEREARKRANYFLGKDNDTGEPPADGGV